MTRVGTAARLAAAYDARFQIPDSFVSSAGCRAVIGHAIHKEAATVLRELGGDPSDFAARQLAPRIAAGADPIPMTAAHRDAVLKLNPLQLRKTFTLSEAARLASDHNAKNVADLASLRPQLAEHQRPDVADPIGQRAEVFAAAGSEIAGLLLPILELLRRSSSPATGWYWPARADTRP